MSTLQGPELHLDVSALKRSVLLLEVSTLQGPELHLDVSALQRSVLLLEVSTLQRYVSNPQGPVHTHCTVERVRFASKKICLLSNSNVFASLQK